MLNRTLVAGTICTIALIFSCPAVAQEATPAAAPEAAPPAAPAAAPSALTGAVGETQTGLAAVYSGRLHGRRTASGERYNQNALTTAHQMLPFGTMVKVTRLSNNKSVVLRVNDRGPKQPNRILDISRRAARDLGMRRPGLMQVKLEVVEPPKAKR